MNKIRTVLIFHLITAKLKINESEKDSHRFTVWTTETIMINKRFQFINKLKVNTSSARIKLWLSCRLVPWGCTGVLQVFYLSIALVSYKLACRRVCMSKFEKKNNPKNKKQKNTKERKSPSPPKKLHLAVSSSPSSSISTLSSSMLLLLLLMLPQLLLLLLLLPLLLLLTSSSSSSS